jgi:23S rRNA pseudouridine955/2504/2580 synthase
MEKPQEFRAGPNDANRRLDRVLRFLLGGLALSSIYGALRRGRIRVNGRKAAPDYRLAEGDLITVDGSLEATATSRVEASGPSSQAQTAASQARIRPWIVHRDEDLLFVDKPRGLATHGPSSLETLVRNGFSALAASSLAFVPGPLHRLDRNTSGLICFSLSIRGAQGFTRLLREGRLRKRYLALVKGSLASEEYWEDSLARDEEEGLSRESEAGKTAKSRIRPLLVCGASSLLSVHIETGRTHQIRAQCALHGHPLIGDHKYGETTATDYLLHSWILDFAEPPYPGLPRRLKAELPAMARTRLERIFGQAELEEALAREEAREET